MSKSNSKYQLGDKVIISDTKQIGVITKLTPDGLPELILSGNKVINVVDKIVGHIDKFILVWRFIKSLFKF